MHINNRIIALIKLLSVSNKPLSSSGICARLKIKARTLRKDLVENKALLNKNGIEIASKHGVGYTLNIVDENKYFNFIREMLKNENQYLLPVVPEERVIYLIRLLLISNNYQKLDEIAEGIYISRSTLNNDLKEVRSRLKDFNLDIDSKPAYGIKIQGSELHLRSCMAKYFFSATPDQQFTQHDLQHTEQGKIRDLLYSALQENKLKLTDIGFQNLTVHIFISIMRNKNKVPLQPDVPASLLQLRSKKEFQVAKALGKGLEEAFNMEFPDIEIYYLTIHLLGKKTFDYNNKNFIITEEIQELFGKIYDRIKSDFHIDFSDDFELYTLLALHFQPMLDRLKYELAIDNPVLDKIKETNLLAFNMAVSAGMVIEENTGLSVSENELGYMALHFALAYERKKQQVKDKNIIVVCASGAGSSQILLYKIRQRFGKQLNNIYISSLYELGLICQKEYDFILSTIPIPFETDIPVIQVEYFLSDKDSLLIDEALSTESGIDFISDYFRQDLIYTDIQQPTKEGIINEMCNRLRSVFSLPDNFSGLILQREEVSSTEYGNMVAFPHPIIPVGEHTFVAVAILPKAVKWKKHNVRYVFLLSIKKKEEDHLSGLYEVLVDLFYNQSLLKKFEQAPTIDTLKELFRKSNTTSKEVSQNIFQ